MQFLRSVAECAFALRLSKNDLFCHSERMRRILARLKNAVFSVLTKDSSSPQAAPQNDTSGLF